MEARDKLFLAIENADLKGVKDVLLQNSRCVNMKDLSENAALHIAVQQLHEAAMSRERECTSYSQVLQECQPQIDVLHYLAKKADLRVRNRHKRRPLQELVHFMSDYANEDRFIVIAQWLLTKQLVAYYPKESRMILQTAIQDQQWKLATLLVDHNVDIRFKCFRYGATILHMAVKLCERAISPPAHVIEALSRRKMLDEADHLERNTALHIVAKNKDAHLINVLTKLKAKTNCFNVNGRTPAEVFCLRINGPFNIKSLIQLLGNDVILSKSIFLHLLINLVKCSQPGYAPNELKTLIRILIMRMKEFTMDFIKVTHCMQISICFTANKSIFSHRFSDKESVAFIRILKNLPCRIKYSECSNKLSGDVKEQLIGVINNITASRSKEITLLSICARSVHKYIRVAVTPSVVRGLQLPLVLESKLIRTKPAADIFSTLMKLHNL